MIVEILLVLLFGAVGIIGVLVYIISNLNKKISIYERWVEKFRNRIGTIYADLKTVDDKNLFEKDDDVGFVFSEMLRVVKDFNDSIQ